MRVNLMEGVVRLLKYTVFKNYFSGKGIDKNEVSCYTIKVSAYIWRISTEKHVFDKRNI